MAALMGVLAGLLLGVAASYIYWRDRAGPVGQQMLANVGLVKPPVAVANPPRPELASFSSATVSPVVVKSLPAAPTAPEEIYTPAPVHVVAKAEPPPEQPPTKTEIKDAVEINTMGIIDAMMKRSRQAADEVKNGSMKNDPYNAMKFIPALMGMMIPADLKVVMVDFEVVGIEKANGRPGWNVDVSYNLDAQGASGGSEYVRQMLSMATLPGYAQVSQFRIVKRPDGGWVALRDSN
jgi:hypothetical protein